MTPEQAEEYTQALGQIFTGSWRLIKHAHQQGIPQALGLTTRDWVKVRLGGYVQLELSERREVVQELAAEGMTQRQIGDVLGISHQSVGRDLGPDGPEQRESDADLGPDGPKPKPEPISEEERIRRRDAKEYEAGVKRDVNRLLNFLDGWSVASNLHRIPDREVILAALDDFDRNRFLKIEEEIAWRSNRTTA